MEAETPKSKRGGKRPGAGRKRKPGAPRTKPLDNPRHEQFAQGIAEGKTKAQAYVDAGYAHNPSNANRLNSNEQIRERAEALKAAVIQSVIERSVCSKEYVLEALVSTLERCRQATPVLDRRGQIVMVETEDGELTPAYTFDAKSVLRSAELLGKELGMFKDRVEHTGADGGPIETADLSPREMAQRAAFILKRGIQAPAPKPN